MLNVERNKKEQVQEEYTGDDGFLIPWYKSLLAHISNINLLHVPHTVAEKSFTKIYSAECRESKKRNKYRQE